MPREFYITDVFAEGPYAGNRLATLSDASGLSAETMQNIARAFNFAETTFVCGGSLAEGYDVRIFTPASELPFAGHPTLGTSYLIRNVIAHTSKTAAGAEALTLNLGVGPIPVHFANDGVLWMTQQSPTFGEVFEKKDVAAGLGLQLQDLDPSLPCQIVSTGLPFLLVPLASYEALARAMPIDRHLHNTIFLFCRGGYESGQQIQARMFAGELGVPEDPATGSANGCLAGYLSQYEMFGSSDVDVRVGQGYEIDRPSQLYLKSSSASGTISVQVGGRVSLVARGEWLI